MRIQINERDVNIAVDFDVRWRVRLEPGVWVTENRGEQVSVTSLSGALTEGEFHIAFPKGVARKAGGGWSAQERILVDILPADPGQAWRRVLPAQVREAIEDAYLLSREDLPNRLERERP